MVGAPIKTPSPTPPAAQKTRPSPPQREPGAPRRPGKWPSALRGVISALIVWHFTAIFLAALSVPGPTSALVRNIAQHPKSPVRWYLDATYLNQGHSFFAPEVGCGYLITYECFDSNGQPIEKGELPSRKENWPRLLYHRYFMLASQAEWGSEDDKQTYDNWQRKYLDAYARHLLYANKDAQSVRVRRFAHWPLPIEFAASDRKKGYETLVGNLARRGENKRIDAQGYEFLGETVQRRSDLEPETGRQTMNQNLYWQNNRANTASRWNGVPR
jgi:hypothetical protein